MNYPCPMCGSYNTDRVYQHQEADELEQVWVCNDCPHEYTVLYGNPEVVSVKDAEGNAVDPGVYA